MWFEIVYRHLKCVVYLTLVQILKTFSEIIRNLFLSFQRHNFTKRRQIDDLEGP